MILVFVLEGMDHDIGVCFQGMDHDIGVCFRGYGS